MLLSFKAELKLMKLLGASEDVINELKELGENEKTADYFFDNVFGDLGESRPELDSQG